jgi:hypothetical protein
LALSRRTHRVGGSATPRLSSNASRLSFADADHGWLTDSHTIWGTANGGLTWTQTALPVTGSVRDKLDFITAQMVGVDGSAVLVAKYDATPGMDGARGQRVFYRTVDRGAHRS